MSMMHSRIEYPELQVAEGKRNLANGSSSKESSAANGGSEKAERSGQEVAAS